MNGTLKKTVQVYEKNSVAGLFIPSLLSPSF